jgi:tetratricopeptide (TPR) repeat protein
MQAQTNFDQAESLFYQEKFEMARSLFESYLKSNPSNLKTLEYLGDIHGHFKNWDKAIFYYEKLKNKKPTEANYFYKYGGVLGMKAKESNRFVALSMIGDVKAAFEKSILLNPKHIEARYALVELYLQLPGIVGGSERKANKYADELMIISPIDGNLSKGRISEYANQYKSAEKYYRTAFELGKSKITYQKLYDFYSKIAKLPQKALLLKTEFENKI